MESRVNITKQFVYSGHNTAVFALCAGPEEHTFISGSGDKYIAQWNLLNGQQEKFAAKMPAAVYSLLPLYEMDQLWVGTGNGHIHVIDIKQKEEIHVFRFHKGQVFDIQYSPATGMVYSSGGDGLVCCYDPQKLKHLHSQKFSEVKVRSVAFYKGKLLLAEGTGKTIIINADDFATEHDFISHKLATNCYLVEEEEALLLSGGRDAHLNVWDIKNNYFPVKSIPAHNFAIYKIADLYPYQLIATASRDKTVKIWAKDTLQFEQRIAKENLEGHNFSVNSILWNNQLNTLISAGDDRTIISWRIST